MAELMGDVPVVVAAAGKRHERGGIAGCALCLLRSELALCACCALCLLRSSLAARFACSHPSLHSVEEAVGTCDSSPYVHVHASKRARAKAGAEGRDTNGQCAVVRSA